MVKDTDKQNVVIAWCSFQEKLHTLITAENQLPTQTCVWSLLKEGLVLPSQSEVRWLERWESKTNIEYDYFDKEKAS